MMPLSSQRVSPVETRTEFNQFYANAGAFTAKDSAKKFSTFAKIVDDLSAIIDALDGYDGRQCDPVNAIYNLT